MTIATTRTQKQEQRGGQLGALRANLQALRHAAGLTQHDLAMGAGVQLRTYATYEAGSSMPPLDVACRLADALGTTVGALLAPAPREKKESSVPQENS